MIGRTIAIGDIHGCSKAAAALIDAIAPGSEDTIVTLGDYIDRGQDTRGVLDKLIALNAQCRLIPLMGNHEERLLDALRSKQNLRRWLISGVPIHCVPMAGQPEVNGVR
jgi:serine/threonine protein phosphatase 1